MTYFYLCFYFHRSLRSFLKCFARVKNLLTFTYQWKLFVSFLSSSLNVFYAFVFDWVMNVKKKQKEKKRNRNYELVVLIFHVLFFHSPCSFWYPSIIRSSCNKNYRLTIERKCMAMSKRVNVRSYACVRKKITYNIFVT